VDFFEEEMGEGDVGNPAQAPENRDGLDASEHEEKSTENVVPKLDDAEVKEAEATVASGNAEYRVDAHEKFIIVDDPYVAGQCTTRVTLVISPDDGHEQGSLVFIAATTHDELPGTFLTCRLKELALPPQILDAIAMAHETLSQRGEEKEAARQLAARKKREADEKEKQRQQKKQALAKKEAEKKKAEEKRATEPQVVEMFAALGL
jgi:hypothetical protein